MGAVGIEVVTRAIQIRRKQEDAVETVLSSIGLSLNQQQLLGDAVRRVCFFRVPIPQVILAKGDGRELGVGAYRAQDYHLVDTRSPTLVNELSAHHQVVVQVGGRVHSVRSDSPDPCGQMNHQVRFGLVEDRANCVGLAKVILRTGWRKDRLVASRTQLVEHMRAQETTPTSDEDPALLRRRHHSGPSTFASRRTASRFANFMSCSIIMSMS